MIEDGSHCKSPPRITMHALHTAYLRIHHLSLSALHEASLHTANVLHTRPCAPIFIFYATLMELTLYWNPFGSPSPLHLHQTYILLNLPHSSCAPDTSATPSIGLASVDWS